MNEEDILVVAPYNVQVNYLKSILPKGARVGTIDKFQGQQAPVTIITEFKLNRNLKSRSWPKWLTELR